MKAKSFSLIMLLFLIYTSSHAANIALVPRTGQTPSSPITAPSGSDGALQKGAPWPNDRFKPDLSGNCIIDNLTGLMWVRNLNTVNNGNRLVWNAALTTATNGRWCGYSDWRVPNINELGSLINYSQSEPATWLNADIGVGAGFSNVQTSPYWSSSTAAYSSGLAWQINMFSGIIGVFSKEETLEPPYLLPVRGGK